MKLNQLTKDLNFQAGKLLIIGDVMLDQYWFGGTSRISPEAPVPIVKVENITECPGGAANVALGIATLGAEPYLLGLTGLDAAVFRLEELLDEQKVCYHLERVATHPTITKLRVLSRSQQMVRLDTEKKFPSEAGRVLRKYFLEMLEKVNTVILSDYGKGTLSDSLWYIEQAKLKGIPIIVDPKSIDFSIYRGADVITPNLKEFEAVVGQCATLEILVEKATQLLLQYEINALVITRGEMGLSVITKETVTHLPALARQVHDVTGAGDTVIAVLATALSAGYDLVKSAHFGNVAAGISVAKLGAVAVTIQEISDALSEQQDLPSGVMSLDVLLSAVRSAKANGERIVFTNGCFDILHAGHLPSLELAKKLGDRLIVAVNSDDSIARLKGANRPFMKLSDRMAVLAGLRCVDWVVSFDEDTPEKIIQKISPQVLVKGREYYGKDIPGAQFVLSQGGEVRFLGEKTGSSTEIGNKVLQEE